MTERDTEITRRLVVGHKRDGRCCYDKEAKRELVEACLQPGISVARMALEHGINANMLRTWISRYQAGRLTQVGSPGQAQTGLTRMSAFAPVVQAKHPTKTAASRFMAQLPNGITLDLSELSRDELLPILGHLCKLPCSASTPG